MPEARAEDPPSGDVRAADASAADPPTADVPAADSRLRVGPAVSTACAIAGVLLPATLLPLRQLLVFGLLATALLPWAAVLLRPAWRPLTHVLAGAVTLALTAFALTVIYYQGHPVEAAAAKPATATRPPPSMAALASDVKFLQTTRSIPHCVSFMGTGSVPDRYALVLFDRPSDAAGHFSATSTFSYDGQATPSADGRGWTAPDRDIGSGDDSDQEGHIAIVAVLMPRAAADFLDVLTVTSDSGLLPPSVTSLGATADQVIVTRNAQNASC